MSLQSTSCFSRRPTLCRQSRSSRRRCHAANFLERCFACRRSTGQNKIVILLPYINIVHTPDWRWTHSDVENVTAAIVLAATHPNTSNKLFNVGEAYTPTIEEPLKLLPASTMVSDCTDADDFRQDIVYSTKKIRHELGYRAIVP